MVLLKSVILHYRENMIKALLRVVIEAMLLTDMLVLHRWNIPNGIVWTHSCMIWPLQCDMVYYLVLWVL